MYLASDSMKGRVDYSPEQAQVVRFIGNEFKNYGLTFLPNQSSYRQAFTIPGNTDDTLYNVIGVLPGTTKPEEIVIFSAHYDHVNRASPLLPADDEIYNGANDDASGCTAVLELAKYYAAKKDNARTLIFCLFAGEEAGLRGSSSFVRQTNLAGTKAVLNIEMIGNTNRSGKNAFFITGSTYSDLMQIMKKNLAGQKIKIAKEGDDNTNLFARSDNYSFFKAGICAHSIMCSDDKEYCYHKPCDDVRRIDLDNMTDVIRGIALGSRTLVSGEDTPIIPNQVRHTTTSKWLNTYFFGIPLHGDYVARVNYVSDTAMLGIDSVNSQGAFSSVKCGTNHFPFPDSVPVKILLMPESAVPLTNHWSVNIEAVFSNDIRGRKKAYQCFSDVRELFRPYYKIETSQYGENQFSKMTGKSDQHPNFIMYVEHDMRLNGWFVILSY